MGRDDLAKTAYGFGATCLVWGFEVATLPLGWAGLFTTLGLLAASVYGAVV